MKYNYLNFTTICFSGLLWSCCFTALSQDILWEKSYGGKHSEYLFDAQPTADYGFILAGSSLSDKSGNKINNNNGDLDYWVWKMNEKGDFEWQKSFGGSGFDLLQSIKNPAAARILSRGNCIKRYFFYIWLNFKQKYKS